jgi:hypothetical protein
MDIGKFFSQNQTESLVNFGVQIRGLILHNVKVILNLLGKKKRRDQTPNAFMCV